MKPRTRSSGPSRAQLAAALNALKRAGHISTEQTLDEALKHHATRHLTLNCARELATAARLERMNRWRSRVDVKALAAGRDE